jgi:hypothetical protein
LLKTIRIAAVSGEKIYRAVDLNWNDFEDAVQYKTAPFTQETACFISKKINFFIHARVIPLNRGFRALLECVLMLLRQGLKSF